jgi:hypothetical protein
MVMKCPHCGADNSDTEKYCTGCANSLESARRVPLKRNVAVVVLALLVLLSLLLLSIVALASVPGFALPVKVPVDGTYDHHVVALVGDNITVSWDSSEVLVFALIDPSGEAVFGTGSRSFEKVFPVYMSGEWTLHWSNPNDVSVKMSYDASSSTLDNIPSPLLTEVAWLVATAVILIVALIVGLVFAIHRSGHLGVLESLKRR